MNKILLMAEYLIVYGSLRKGLWNYQQHLAPFEPIETLRIQGFDMYTVSGNGYPFEQRLLLLCSKCLV